MTTHPETGNVAAVLVDTVGDVRLVYVNPTRRDLILELLDAFDVAPIILDDLILVIDSHAAREGARLNLGASFLAYPRDAIRGDVLVFGRDEENAPTDVPDEFLLIFDVDLSVGGDPS